MQLHQQKGMISLSPPTICNSARHPVAVYGGVGRTIRLLAELLESCYDSNSIMR
nr:hypothetical protein [Enterobacteriaceae bacterium]